MLGEVATHSQPFHLLEDELTEPLNPPRRSAKSQKPRLPAGHENRHQLPSQPALSTSVSVMANTYMQRLMSIEASDLMRYSRYTNVILGALQALAGFLGLFDLVRLDITSFFISLYAIILALLLVAFECRFVSMEPWLRDQFGFLFSYRGRTLFLFFVGFMTFGIDNSLGSLVAILMTANAALNAIVLIRHPEFCCGAYSSNMDPTQNYTHVSQEASTALHNNPQFMAKAGEYALRQAQNNPQIILTAAERYASSQSAYVPPIPSA